MGGACCGRRRISCLMIGKVASWGRGLREGNRDRGLRSLCTRTGRGRKNDHPVQSQARRIRHHYTNDRRVPLIGKCAR